MSGDKRPRILGVSADAEGVRLAYTYDGLRSDVVEFVTIDPVEAVRLAADLTRSALPSLRPGAGE